MPSQTRSNKEQADAARSSAGHPGKYGIKMPAVPTLQNAVQEKRLDAGGFEGEQKAFIGASLQPEMAAFKKPSGSAAQGGVVQKVIGPGGIALRGRRVRAADGKIYQIIGDIVFRNKVEYKLADSDGNEFYIALDRPGYDLVPFGERLPLPPVVTDDDVPEEEDDELDEAGEFIDKLYNAENPYGIMDAFSDEQVEDTVPHDKARVAKTWDIVSVKKALAASSSTNPLEQADIIEIEEWLSKNLLTISRTESKIINADLLKAKKHILDFESLITSKRPKTSGSRKKKEKKTETTFDNVSDSELSDEDYSPDSRFAKYPSSMAAVVGRSHVYGIEDDARFRYIVTGLPYADTYLALFKDGMLVPRTLNSAPNTTGMRKRLREVETRIKPHLEKRDELFAELDALNGKITNVKATKGNLVELTETRNEKFTELQALLRDSIRPHVESLLFGSSTGGGPDSEDMEATGEAAEGREKIKRALIAEKNPSAAADLFKQQPPRAVSSGRDSSTHAEQSLIHTRTWQSLVNQLVKAIGTNKHKPEELAKTSFTSLQLVLNRSTCIGCARELTAELIRFWTGVALVTGKKSWREAKHDYEPYVSFLLDFPAIYEYAQEKKSEQVNIQRIILGLRDAGWTVSVFTGVKTGTESDVTNAEAKKLVSRIASTPMFYTPGWNGEIVDFAVPEIMKAAVAGSSQVMVNGIVYQSTKDKKYLRQETGMALKLSAVDKYKFYPTGIPKSLGKGGSIDEEEPGSLSEEEPGSDFSDDDEEYEYETGRILHAPNSCYLAVLIHLFASQEAFLNLFDRDLHDVELENGPQPLHSRQLEQQRGQAIQMQSGIRQAINILLDPEGVVEAARMSYIMRFLGLLGNMIDSNQGAGGKKKSKSVKPEELDSQAKTEAEDMLKKETSVLKKPTVSSVETLKSKPSSKPLSVDMSKKAPRSWGVQQDAAEVLLKLLQLLRPGNNLTIEERSTLGPDASVGFAGTIQTVKGYTLQLPIDGDINSIEEALQNYSTVEDDVEYAGGHVTKQVTFSALPQVLTIVLKRFSADLVTQTTTKIHKAVSAPDVLTMPAECLSGDLAEQNIQYSLHHFVKHEGTYQAGHYVSFAKDSDEEWHKHDDLGGLRSKPSERKLREAKETSYIYVYELLQK